MKFKAVQCKNAMVRQMMSDNGAISSTIDVMVFLVMVSLSAVVLMPVMLSSGYNAAVQDVAAYKYDGQLLQSLLGSRAEGFEYIVTPIAFSDSSTIPAENAMHLCQYNTIFAREHTSRTFSDLIAEGMLFSLRTEANGTYCYLHPFSTGYSQATEKILEEHLNRRIGGRYSYRLEANWQPVSGCGTLSTIVVGDVPPEGAFRQSAVISVPYTHSVSLADISSPADDLRFGIAVNSSNKEYELRSMFDECIYLAALSASVSIVNMCYPEDSLQKISNGQVNVVSLGASLMGTPAEGTAIEKTIAADILINTANFTSSIYVNSTNITMLTEANVNLAARKLQERHTSDIYSYISDAMAEEINDTMQAMMQTDDIITLLELRDKQLYSIYKHVRPPAAEVTLVIW